MKKKEILNVALYLFAFLTIQAITIAVVMLVSQTAGITAGTTTITTLVSSLITIALFYKLRWTPCSGDYINTRPWFTMFWVVCLTIGTIAPLAYLNELLGVELPDTYNELFKVFDQLSLYRLPVEMVFAAVVFETRLVGDGEQQQFGGDKLIPSHQCPDERGTQHFHKSFRADFRVDVQMCQYHCLMPFLWL